MTKRALVIHPDDNVANLIGPGEQGETVECLVEGRDETTQVELREEIPPNHKFAFTEIGAGQPVLKYGYEIGKATEAIHPGAHVHAHNIQSNRGRGDLS